MLGDSIINDIGNSFYDILIKGLYPKAKIEVITSVKGETGCWYYEKENKVKDFVLDYKPDLLIIGGIGNRDDVESIRNVIKQVREKQNPEIIVMSKAVGKEGDPRTNSEWTYEIVENTYRDRLRKMAEEEKVEFFDIEKYWGEYIKNSDLPYDTFLRDPVHANELGRIVLAYLLFYYFVE
ncbi:MAG: GDSL-type esterase/lipase family protein [Candidatus Omnitrophica bacterium]|nr:GDSL-type esterase/lipase family protein [Candidatus Omnitrophota bacterium]